MLVVIGAFNFIFKKIFDLLVPHFKGYVLWHFSIFSPISILKLTGA